MKKWCVSAPQCAIMCAVHNLWYAKADFPVSKLVLPIKCGLARCWYLASRLGLRMTPLGWSAATLVNGSVGLFVFDPLLSTACCLLRLSPRITPSMKSSLPRSLDSDQRLLRDEVWDWTSPWFNNLFWRPAFKYRSLCLGKFLCFSFGIYCPSPKNDHILLETAVNKQIKKSKDKIKDVRLSFLAW